MIIDKKDRVSDNLLYQRLRRVHYGMMRRCYTKHDSSYSNYGGKGVTVSPEWHDFEGFLKTVDTVAGFDIDRYVPDKLALDKDTVWGNKLYSPSTCRFITPAENNQTKPNQQYRIVGMSPDGTVYRFNSANGFAEKHGLNYNGILKVVKGGARAYRGWQFCKEEDFHENKFVEPYSWERTLVGLSPTGATYNFTNSSSFAREHGLIEATTIIACAKYKNTHTRGWQFRYVDELEENPFLPKDELNIVGCRDTVTYAVAPSGERYEFKNATQFAKDHNLNRHRIRDVYLGKLDDTQGWVFSR